MDALFLAHLHFIDPPPLFVQKNIGLSLSQILFPKILGPKVDLIFHQKYII